MAPSDLLLFQIPYGRHSFDYYYENTRLSSQPEPAMPTKGGDFLLFLPLVSGGRGKAYLWAEGLYTNGGMSPEGVDRGMSGLAAGHGVVWLIATEVPLWDERGLVQAWLAEHGTLTDEAQFVGVTVMRYELR
jgi:hypothetical protein